MQSLPSTASSAPGAPGTSWAELDPGEHGDKRTAAFGDGMLERSTDSEEDCSDDGDAPDEEKSEVIREADSISSDFVSAARST